MSDCQHNWTPDGVAFEHGHQLSGSGARRRLYYDVYACRSCLKRRAFLIDANENSYQDVRYGARPLGADVDKTGAGHG